MVDYYNKHLMAGLKGNNEFCLPPETLRAEENIDAERKQTNLLVHQKVTPPPPPLPSI